MIYKKNRNLYFTKEFISSVKKRGYAILVEGYFDVLSLNQLGYSNSASPSGTALTIQQLEAVSRYTNKILLCFDNDEAGLKATERVLEINTDNQIKVIEKNFTFLATVGATAPFIGLFGTVWGIMNSFQSIAISRNTSLAIVAPGIAEALFATALGLLAAIPAVVAYNKFNSDSKKYSQKLENFSKRFTSII